MATPPLTRVPPRPPEHVEPLDQRLATAQAQLDELARQLGQSQRLATIGMLSAGVAHEINNILTPVLSYAQVARSRPDDRALQAKAYDKIIAGVESACAVVEAVLDFAKDSDQPSVAHVAGILEQAMACLARDPEKDGIELDTRVHDQAVVRMRPQALQQVLLNLILNARAAIKSQTSAGAGRITVTTEPRATVVVLAVSDNGPGVPPDVADRIFDAFVSTKRQSPTAARRGADAAGGGAGLGLMITRHLVEEAGGSIRLDTTSRPGARFEITLPAADATGPDG